MRRLHLHRWVVLLICAGLTGLSANAASARVRPARRPAARHLSTRHERLRHLASGGSHHHPAKLLEASLARLATKRRPLALEAPRPYASCSDAAEPFARAADENAATLDSLDWAPFGRPEKGWQVYSLLVGREIGASCGAGTPKFAEKLAIFQTKWKLPADGVFTPATFEVVKGLLQEARPFVMARLAKICPDAPPESELVAVPTADETFGREGGMVRADVFAAYERMVAAAHAELPSLKDDPKALTIFSAYRSPESDAERCDSQGNCDGLRRAVCSSHRTGTALDINVGWVPGVAADSTSPENRLLQTRTETYAWLVANAARFGFVNYPYEPWHWEWVGAPGEPALGPIPPPLTTQLETAASPATPANPAADPHRPPG